MLILTHQPGTITRIKLEDGREITVNFLGVKGRQVKIGWEADKTISVLRDNAGVREPKGKTAQ